MRHPIVSPALFLGALALMGCAQQSDEQSVQRALNDVNVVDESNLNDVMLTVADPNEAVDYFTRSLKNEPDRLDFQRGLAKSLVRAKRSTEGVRAWRKVTQMEGTTDSDAVELADALIRTNDWDAADKVLNAIPPTYETFQRYRLEAMVADSNEEWEKSDSFYEIAAGLTTDYAGVLNNWGFSKLTRGDFSGAEQLFGEAIRQDKNLFTAKNNLVMARGAQRNYTLPVIPLTQVERAKLLHTMALSAVKQNDVQTAKALLRDAIDTHPQHFEEAARSLSALEKG